MKGARASWTRRIYQPEAQNIRLETLQSIDHTSTMNTIERVEA